MNETFTIQETAERTGLSAHTLRYYERIGLILPVPRTSGGHRQYCENDIEWIGFLKCLRSTGMPVREMQRYAELLRQGQMTVSERIALLEAHRERIEEEMRTLADNLEAIRWKIEHYKELEEQVKHEQEVQYT
jgi:DNA-binding transcriptional MerR regulator